jgi:hypothetical protein
MLKKVRSGDPLVIPAATFNTFIDAAQDFQDRQRSTSGDWRQERRQADMVLVRNESGADRGRFDVLGIAGPIIGRADNEDEFKQRVALHGVVPTESHRAQFVVLLEPLASSAIGLACIAGVCPVRVEMINEAHRCAEVKPDDASKLKSSVVGSAQLLWVEPAGERADPTIAWAVARLGVPATSQRFRIKDGGHLFEYGQYDIIMCNAVDEQGNPGELDTPVAVPWWFRRSVWNGRTRSSVTYSYVSNQWQIRTATRGGASQSQKITPYYIPGDELLAVAAETGAVYNGDAVMWQDINDSGRVWGRY